MKSSIKGYTLIEAVMVITLTAILTFSIGGFILGSLRGWLFISGRETALNSSLIAMQRVTAELRRINSPQSILTADASECSFVDIDGQIVDFKNNVDSVTNLGNLMRNNDILCSGIAPGGVAFTYLDSFGNPTLLNYKIRSIRLHLRVASGEQTVELESSARIRNFR